MLIQLFYEELFIFCLFDTFIPCQLCIKVTNFVLCAITLVGFPDDDRCGSKHVRVSSVIL